MRAAEFEPTTEVAALKEAIISRIHEEGAISFHDFMALALYHPGLGYYCSPRDKIGREGDYLTSPHVSPVFGAIVGRQLREMWQAMGRPARFQIVEAGAGTGLLARDLLRWAGRDGNGFAEAIDYQIVEVSEPLAAHQRQALTAEGLAHKAGWSADLPDAVQGCILSNELLDSLPVHRVAVAGGGLREMFVAWDGARFREELRPAEDGIQEYFRRLRLLPGAGCRAEVNLEALRWMRRAAAALQRGFVLTFDYGYEAGEMFAPWRRDGTLLCFYRHNPSTDPYVRIGRQDMTSHVDFTSLRRAGEEAGLGTLDLTSQSEFLSRLGIADALSPPAAGRADLEEYYARRRAIMDLLDPAGLGRIKVLIQSKGVAAVALSGLGEGRR